jgi:DnaJ family protein C protein 19
MIFFLLGVAALIGLMLMLGAFSRAQVATIKQLGLWIVAIGGVLLAVMLLLTGRGLPAIVALLTLGPMLWGEWHKARPGARGPAPRRGAMSREEAYQVLGLSPGAGAAEIRAAHRRLMRTAHPDAGGSDWLAARVNQARDVLLG